MGATLGGAYGVGLRELFPGLHVDPAALALAGMAGLVAGTTGAALTAIVMIFEMTLDYSVVLPMTLTVAVSYGLRRIICSESMYTMKLVRRGHPMPWALQANAYLVHHVTEMTLDAVTVLPSDTIANRVALDERADADEIVLTGADGHVCGLLSRAWALGHREAIEKASTLADVARDDFVIVSATTTIVDVLAQFQTAHASVAIVVKRSAEPGKVDEVLGLVTKTHLAEALAEGMELFGD
jgi:CIC family chloride channel protein